MNVSRTKTRDTILIDPVLRTPVDRYRDLLYRRLLFNSALAITMLIIGCGWLRRRRRSAHH